MLIKPRDEKISRMMKYKMFSGKIRFVYPPTEIDVKQKICHNISLKIGEKINVFFPKTEYYIYLQIRRKYLTFPR